MAKDKGDIFRQSEYINHYYDYKKSSLAGVKDARKKKIRRQFGASLVVLGIIIGLLHGDIIDKQMKNFLIKSLSEEDMLAQSALWVEKGAKLIYTEAIPALANEKNTGNSTAALPLAGRVVSSFGWQKAEEKFNKGIVLETDEVSAVKAAYDGTVEKIYKDGEYYTIVLTHEGGLKSVYGGCASVLAKENMRVQKGDIIGYSGVYQVEKSRIYFEITRFGEPVDPLSAVGEKQV